MSRTELERLVRWLVRRPPGDPAKLVPFLAEVLVEVVEENNKAVAAHLAGRDAREDGEGF